MCNHKFIKTMQGWFCTECKQFFAEKPIMKELKIQEEKPKKRNSKNAPKK